MPFDNAQESENANQRFPCAIDAIFGVTVRAVRCQDVIEFKEVGAYGRTFDGVNVKGDLSGSVDVVDRKGINPAVPCP